MATKNPFPEERGLPACEPYLPHALASDASELAPASRRTGCCGFAGPGPPPLWIRLCFSFSPERELTRKLQVCQCAPPREAGQTDVRGSGGTGSAPVLAPRATRKCSV